MHVKSALPMPPLPPVNVHDFLFRRPDVLDKADYMLYVDGVTGREQTYRQFVECINDGATALMASVSEGGLGLRSQGEMVGILGYNSMDYSALMHSLLMATVPYALFPSTSTQRELVALLRIAKPTSIFVDPSFLSVAEAAAAEIGLPSDKIFFIQSGASGRTSFGEIIERVKARGIPRAAVRPVQKDTLAHLIFSSGTSGLPKAVAISQANLVFALMQYIVLGQAVFQNPEARVGPAESAPIILASLPIYHTYGLFTYCFRHFLRPGKVVFVPRWNTDLVLSMIPKYKVTSLLLVPSQVHQLLQSPNLAKTDMSSVLEAFSSAAHLPSKMSQELNKYISSSQEHLSEAYGMSEATISIALRLPLSLTGSQGASSGSGPLMPGMEARILREDGSEADVNEPGDVYLKGGNIALGYWGDEKATKETFLPSGWLKTGDRFRVDEKGHFYFAERVKDTLKIGGVQVSPSEIEDVLIAEPEKLIIDVSVVGVSGGRTSDEKNPRAWIVLSEIGKRQGTDAVVQKLDAWVHKNLSKQKWLRGGYEVVDEIPKNSTGKTLRRVLAERYENSLKSRAKL